MPIDSTRQLPEDFNPRAPETFTSAHEEYAELRQRCPVAHSNDFNGFWALFRYDDVVNALRDPDTFITSVQNIVPKVAFTGRRPPLHFDPPEHTPYRRAITPFFTPEKMEQLAPELRRLTVELLQPFIDAGGGDICDQVTHSLPGYLLAPFFHFSTELSMTIREVSKAFSRALQEANDEMVKTCSLQLYEVAREIIAMRKAAPLDPAEDITCAMLAAEYDGQPLPEDMVLGTIRQMIVVGMIAPCVFIGSMAVHLAAHPDLQNQLRNDLTLVPAAIEEYLRLFTPYRGFARTARKDVVIGGRTIKKDEPIALVYASANRDESVFPNPDEFILHRPNIQQHVAFGLGPHRCAGESLARLMLHITLEELLRRTKSIEPGGEIVMTRWPEWGTLAAHVKVVAA